VDSLVLGAQVLLAAIFATAGVAKLLDMPGSRTALVGFGLSQRAASAVAPLLPVAELAVAVALVPASSARWAAVGAAALLLMFAAGITNALIRGRTPDCHCFGNLHSAAAGPATLARNLALAGVAAFVAIQGPDTEVGDWVAARSGTELVAVAAAAAALVLAGLVIPPWLRNRRQWRELADALAGPQPEADAEPMGLPAGMVAPGFELSNLAGETRTLESLRAGGRPVLIVFLDPNCGPCHILAPHVARWQAALSERLVVAVISERASESTRALWDGHATEVLLDPESEVTRKAYRVLTWPSAIGIGRDGRISRELVSTQDAMEAVIRDMLEDNGQPLLHSPGSAATTAPRVEI
jgi:uncharacterized membrane protein YphA (DoxX/SURF4 family)/thiol-disulfide isomerase/thioredoxin